VAESVRVGIAARRKQRGIGPELQVLENAYRICKAQERREILPRGKEGFVGNGYARSRMQENIRSEILRVQGDGVAEASIIRARMYGERKWWMMKLKWWIRSPSRNTPLPSLRQAGRRAGKRKSSRVVTRMVALR